MRLFAVTVCYVAVTGITAPLVAQTTRPSRLPLVRIVDLDVGESCEVTLHGGRTALVRLLDVAETRDEPCAAVRASRVQVEVNGQPVHLTCATYHLPISVAGVQIDCPCTRAYAQERRENVWALDKDARLRLWPSDSPLAAPGTFVYPVRQRWFASDTQMANEPVFVDGGDAPSARPVYYHSGLDFGGAEGLVDVLAAADAVVVAAGLDVLPEHGGPPIEARYDVVCLLDERGWLYRYSHLLSIDPAVRPGRQVKMGQGIGILGKEGGSGGWSHLHFELFSRQPSGRWGSQDAYAYVWEAYQRQYRPELIAVARPHHLAWTGQKVVLDGSRSWSAAGRIVRHEWKSADEDTAAGVTAERTHALPGTYSEILKVTDAAGRIAYDFAVVQVLDRENPKRLPPTIHAAYAPTFGIRPGQPVTFKVRSFRVGDAGHEVWDFGDGSPLVKVQSDGNADKLAKDGYAVAEHAFKAPGDYLVRVERVGDKHGRATARLWISVSQRGKACESEPAARTSRHGVDMAE